jgi:hypothetical protein
MLISIFLTSLFLTACASVSTVTPLTTIAALPTSMPAPTTTTVLTTPGGTKTSTADTGWAMKEVLKDWLITPHDLVVTDDEIYVSGNLDGRIAVLNFDGQIQRYYSIEKNPKFDNVCVGLSSDGKVYAVSSKGVWKLDPDGKTEELFRFSRWIDHMTFGPDDNMYIAENNGETASIVRMNLDGNRTTIAEINSSRISDLDFNADGGLFIFDLQHGYIWKYSEQKGVELYSSAFSEFGNVGPVYMTFDLFGNLYISSINLGLVLVSASGIITPLNFFTSGDLYFKDGALYALDIYKSILFQAIINHTTISNERILIEGVVPWYIDHNKDVIVGERDDFLGRHFYNYYFTEPVRIEPNELLNHLQPDQFVFDDSGNVFVLKNNTLKKISPTGQEEFSVNIPGRFQWDTRLHYNNSDGKVYYYDDSSNSILQADASGGRTFHIFSAKMDFIYIAITPQGRVFASFVASDELKLIDITDPTQEIVVYKTAAQYEYERIQISHIASDNEGNIYAAFGPEFQKVIYFALDKFLPTPIVPLNQIRFDFGWVDPQGFTATDSGSIVLSAPGVLVEFSKK